MAKKILLVLHKSDLSMQKNNSVLRLRVTLNIHVIALLINMSTFIVYVVGPMVLLRYGYMLESNALGEASGGNLRLLIYSGYVPNYGIMKKF